MAIELSASSWLVASQRPMNKKVKLRHLEAGDTNVLEVLIAEERSKARSEHGVEAELVSCFEAGRDGFWLHRFLLARGVKNHVVEPTSILVTRGARRAKTDRLDAQGLLRVLAATFTGDHDACRVVNVPTVEEEDAKRPHREREHLVQERVRIENRIAALLATQGIPKRPSLRSWEADLEAWAALAETADKEGWPAARFLAALAEQEMVERSRRRFERHLEEARLPPGKTLDAFDFAAVPMISKAQVQALAAGDAWLEKGANLLCFGPPGGGKSHLAAALGLALIEKGWRVLFTRTTDLVQKLQIARRDLALEAAIAKLDKYHLLILDDLAYVTKDQAETSVLFELISARYERRSLLITANQPFGEWGKIFPDQAMTLAAIDRLVHHATILEMNVDSYRRKQAVEKARGAGRPPTRATIKASS